LTLSNDDEDVPDSVDGESLAETIELPTQTTNTSSGRMIALDDATETEFFNEFEIEGESQALMLYFQVMDLAQNAISQARSALDGGPGTRSRGSESSAEGFDTPRFAWVCYTILDYTAACMVLDKEFDPDPDTSWAHDAAFTFGKIGKNYLVIIYQPTKGGNWDEDSPSTDALQDTLRRRFASIELVLIIGAGGAPLEVSQEFDIRLGDIVVGETASMGIGSDGLYKFQGQPTWWARQAIAKLESRQLRGVGFDWKDFAAKLPPSAQSQFAFPGAHEDILFPRRVLHFSPNQECGDCPQNEALLRAKRSNNYPVIHIGNAFVHTMRDDSESFGAFRNWRPMPMVFTKNGACLVEKFPCLLICGVSNYCDSHGQKRWERYAGLMAAQYTMHLVSCM
jgi:hypothetical protein